MAVEEREKRFSVEARAANDQSPSIGANDAGLTFTWFNLLGRNDPLVLTGDLTEGLREASFYYSVPLTARDLRFHILGQISSADVVDDDVEDLNIESSAKQLTVGFGMPIIDTTANRVGLDLSFNRERNRTYLLNEPFSFSPGTDDGRSDVSVLQFTQDWQNRGRRRAVSLASTFNLGLPILGATDNGNEQPDGDFFYWLGQGQLAHRLFSDRDQVVVRGQAQIATDPLLASQQYSLGGIDTVRGYFVNEVVRDSGFAVGIEYRYPLLDLWDRERIRGPDDMSLELVPFFDYGYGVNHSRQPRGRRQRHAGQPRPGPALDLAAQAAGGNLLGQPLQQPRRLARRRAARRRHQFPGHGTAVLSGAVRLRRSIPTDARSAPPNKAGRPASRTGGYVIRWLALTAEGRTAGDKSGDRNHAHAPVSARLRHRRDQQFIVEDCSRRANIARLGPSVGTSSSAASNATLAPAKSLALYAARPAS